MITIRYNPTHRQHEAVDEAGAVVQVFYDSVIDGPKHDRQRAEDWAREYNRGKIGTVTA
jgi:hypothetical protein